MFMTIFFPLPSYNISHRVMSYRKATSLDVDCNFHVIAESVFFMELDYVLIIFLANRKTPAVRV